MKPLNIILLLIIVAALSIAGTNYFLKQEAQQQVPAMSPPPQTQPVDPYATWTTITPGGVIELKIPPGCFTEAAAGSTYISCPTADNPTPTPEMVISSDGKQVNIRPWEGMVLWSQWDEVISTLRVKTPLSHAVEIKILP